MGANSTRSAPRALLTAALFALGRTAFGQTADQRAAAEVLFNDARRAMDAGEYSIACPKLEQSQQLEASVGALGWLARCYEKLGRTASAWAAYRAAASLAEQRGEAARKALAEERANALEPTLSRLRLDTANVLDVPSVEVSRNGVPVPRALWGQTFPVDPGEHRFEAQAPGYGSVTLRVLVPGTGTLQAVRIPGLIRAPALADDVPRAPEEQPARPPSKPTAAPPGDQGSGTRGPSAQTIAGLIVGGVGVVSLGTGVFFAANTSSELSDRDNACPEVPGGDCASEEQRLEYESHQEAAKSAATASSVAFVTGAILVSAGAVLLLTAPKRSSGAAGSRSIDLAVYPVAQRGGGALWLEGRW